MISPRPTGKSAWGRVAALWNRADPGDRRRVRFREVHDGMAVIGLLPENGAYRREHQVCRPGARGPAGERMRAIRGRQIGLVPQDPMSNLNPVTVGTQVAETCWCTGWPPGDVDRKVVEPLEAAGIPDAERASQAVPTSSPAACASARDRDRPGLPTAAADRRRADVGAGCDRPATILDQIEAMTRNWGQRSCSSPTTWGWPRSGPRNWW